VAGGAREAGAPLLEGPDPEAGLGAGSASVRYEGGPHPLSKLDGSRRGHPFFAVVRRIHYAAAAALVIQHSISSLPGSSRRPDLPRPPPSPLPSDVEASLMQR
jgi:hypothetical protein